MINFKFKAGIGEICQVCGIGGFDHEHPPGTKPKDFVRTLNPSEQAEVEQITRTKKAMGLEPPGKEWWRTPAVQLWFGDVDQDQFEANVGSLVAEARKKAFEECREAVKKISKDYQSECCDSSDDVIEWLDGKLKEI